MSIPAAREADGGATPPGEVAYWEWQAGPDSPSRRPTDLLSAVRGDSSLWPDTVDLDRLGRISTEQWANDCCWSESFAGQTEETWGSWATTWPLPVGRLAIFQAFPPSERHQPGPFASVVPWHGTEYAAFVRSTNLGSNSVTVFCLMDWQVTSHAETHDPVVLFTKAGSCFVVRGPDPTAPAVSSFVHHARA